MSSRDDGGPAYPIEQVTRREYGAPSEWRTYKGMSLRDWLAGHASETDVLAHMDREMITREEAKYAYADAMLKARNQ